MSDKADLALIVGAGPGLSASIARVFSRDGIQVALASRRPEKVAEVAAEIGAKTYRCDVSKPDDVDTLFSQVSDDLGVPDVVVFNPNFQVHGPVVDLNPDDVIKALSIVTFGAFLVARSAAKLMLRRGTGTLLFTGNPSSIRGRPNSSLVAMTKAGLRGLVEALSRELQPKNLHVAAVVADASIDKGNPNDPRSTGPDSLLDPDLIAETFLFLHRQKRTCWSSEIQVRTWATKF